MSKNINNHTDKHTVPRHKEQGSYSKARPTRFLNRLYQEYSSWCHMDLDHVFWWSGRTGPQK